VLIIAAVPTVLFLVPFLAWRGVGFTYSTGERVGYIQSMSSEGTVCDTYEGALMMATSPQGPGSTWQFSVRDKAVADQIVRLKGQNVALHYRQEKGGQLVCLRKTEYVATAVRRIN
jgi:hypothetical protein